MMIETGTVLASGEGGYAHYRIPALIRTDDRTLVLFCEGRQNRRDDFCSIHLLATRSDDGGRSWRTPRVVWREGVADENVSIGNPCPVLDATTGTVWVLFTRNNEQVLASASHDAGDTWSRPREISNDVCPAHWGRYWTGPGHAIQLGHGPARGRLLFPSYHIEGRAGQCDIMRSHAVYSNDHGESWQVGTGTTLGPDIRETIFERDWWPGGFVWAGCECLAAELPNGDVYLTVRNQTRYRDSKAFTRSRDGGVTWEPLALHEEVPGLRCQSALTDLPKENELLLTAIGASPEGGPRRDLTAFLSVDGGRSWPRRKLVHAGQAAYSDLCVRTDGRVLCAFEGAGTDLREGIHLAAFDREWLCASA